MVENNMSTQDIRWQQRLQNYRKALRQLKDAVDLMARRELSTLEKQGVIQSFEYCYELGWNTLRDYLQWQGVEGITGSRDTIREAFKNNLISDGHTWMQMLIDRNRTSHTYNEETAQAILNNITSEHYPLLVELEKRLLKLQEKA